MQKHLFEKRFVVFLFILLLGVALSPSITADAVENEAGENTTEFRGIDNAPFRMNKDTNDEKDNEVTDEYDRWAVIIGISDYQGNDNDLHSPAYDAQLLYNSLQVRDTRWTGSNMKLLTDQQASKANILKYLDWLIEYADDGDIIIFSYNGHGSFVEDQSHDERDGRDEVIVTWDRSYITDDELGEKFNQLDKKNVSGMFLVFDSCLSGGLIDWISWPWENPHIISDLSKDSKVWAEAMYYGNEFMMDITSKNRVVLVSSIPRGIALSLNGPDGWFGFTRGVSRAIERWRRTAEGVCRYAKMWWLSDPTLIKVMLHPLVWLRSLDYWMSERLLICPYPMWKDQYPANFPPGERLQLVK